MIRLFQIAVFGCLGLLLTSCNATEKNDALWEQVKIGDIAPSGKGKRSVGQPLETIDFVVYVFEMPAPTPAAGAGPAENIGSLDDIWRMLYTKPLRFNNYDAFGANSFSVGLGQIQMWNNIRYLLDSAGGKKVKTISLFLLDGQTESIAVAGLNNKQTISYISTDGSMEGATVGPGTLALRIKAEKIPGSRGVCSVDVQPVFSTPITSSILQLAERAKSGEFHFDCCRFRLKMSVGDFVFLGPKKYSNDALSLDSAFFSRPAPSPNIRMFLAPSSGDTEKPQPYSGPVVKTYMIVCSKIND